MNPISRFTAAQALDRDPVRGRDTDGVFDLADLNAFVIGFTAGCP